MKISYSHIDNDLMLEYIFIQTTCEITKGETQSILNSNIVANEIIQKFQ